MRDYTPLDTDGSCTWHLSMAGRHPSTLIFSSHHEGITISILRDICIHSWYSNYVSLRPVECVCFCKKKHVFFLTHHFENGKTFLNDKSQSSLVLFVALTLLICSLPHLLFHNGRILPRETQADCSLCLAHVPDRNLASPAGHQQHVRQHSNRNIIAKPAWLSSGCVL